jgi:putative N6-adenine-specific DNA methylase
MWSANVAPGLSRKSFGFEKWANFGDEEASELRALRGELRRRSSGSSARIIAADIDEDVLDYARANARAAGVKLAFKHQSVLDLQLSQSGGTLVTNPPYGVRLSKEEDFCRRVGAVFSRLHGWRVCLLAGDPDYRRQISIAPKLVADISNGDLKCEFLAYDMP